jgi:hypothetical protein
MQHWSYMVHYKRKSSELGGCVPLHFHSCPENLKGRDHLENQGVDGKIYIKMDISAGKHTTRLITF